MEQLPPLRLIPAVIYCHICGVISLDNKEKSPAPSASQAYFLAPALHLLILSVSLVFACLELAWLHGIFRRKV